MKKELREVKYNEYLIGYTVERNRDYQPGLKNESLNIYSVKVFPIEDGTEYIRKIEYTSLGVALHHVATDEGFIIFTSLSEAKDEGFRQKQIIFNEEQEKLNKLKQQLEINKGIPIHGKDILNPKGDE